MLWILPSELGAAVPTDPARTLWFEHGSTHTCFWTRYVCLAKHVWGLVQADAVGATRAAPFMVFHVVNHQLARKAPDRLGLETSNQRKAELLLADGMGRLADRVIRGVFSAPEAVEYGAADAETPGNYVMARSDAVASAFVAQLMELKFQQTRWLSPASWKTLGEARGIVEEAAAGKRLAKLDESLRTFSLNGHDERAAGDWNEGYVDYAYRCARASVPRHLYLTAIDVGYAGWRAAADTILDTYGVGPHPGIGDQSKWPLDRMPNVPSIVKYFDFFDFGVRNERAAWNQVYLDAADKAIDREHERLRAAKEALLLGRGHYGRFMSTYSPDRTPDRRLTFAESPSRAAEAQRRNGDDERQRSGEAEAMDVRGGAASAGGMAGERSAAGSLRTAARRRRAAVALVA